MNFSYLCIVNQKKEARAPSAQKHLSEIGKSE